MDGPTIGKDKYYISDIERLLIEPYDEKADLALLKKLIHRTNKSFMISENYLYLLEKLGFTLYVPVDDGTTLDLGRTAKFLFPYSLGVTYKMEYIKQGEKGISLCFDDFIYRDKDGTVFYYLRVKSFFNKNLDFFRNSSHFMIVYDENGDEFTFFKKMKDGDIEQKTIRPFTSLPVVKEYKSDKNFYLGYVQFNNKNKVTHIEYRMDGLRFSYNELCQYHPHYKDIGIDKLGKKIESVTNDEIDVIRMIKY